MFFKLVLKSRTSPWDFSVAVLLYRPGSGASL
jgi:hypothetical protein